MQVERRRFLGIAALGLQMALLRDALAQGSVARGVHGAKGEALLNGAAANQGMPVRAGDTVSTGANGEVVFVVGRDAMLLRGDGRVEVQGTAGSVIATGLRIVTGALLSVFAPGEPKQVRTPSATIGIRGTAMYVEVQGVGRTYVCTCYGSAELAAADDPAAREVVNTRHHEQPRYIMGRGAPQRVVRAPMINHTDAELTMLEALVGRKPPFVSQPGYTPGKY